jgi:ornithine decarboxylase
MFAALRSTAGRYARENGVEYTTFDCVSELEKIAAGYPAFKCVLRIRCDDADAKINLGLKYGADLTDVPTLLGMARHLGLQVGRASVPCVCCAALLNYVRGAQRKAACC